MNSRFKPWVSLYFQRLKKACTFILLLGFIVLWGVHNTNAQQDDWRIHLQMTMNFGYPENNIGARIVTEYLGYENLELSLAYSLTYHLNNFGPGINHLEHALMGTFQYVWGDEFITDEEDLAYIKYLDSRRRKNSFGYSWQRFFNGIGTSQNVGTIHMRFSKTIVQLSNDVFANTNGKDRYRTGAFAFGFYEDKTLYTSKLYIWTGDSHCSEVQRIRDSEYPARWGYRDITPCNYGRLSHGILSFGITRDIGYGQTGGLHMGVDSEKIRNYVQNKVFHDLYFIPTSLNPARNLHLPMKTPDGENYLFEEGQQIKPNKFVWQFSLNPSTLY